MFNRLNFIAGFFFLFLGVLIFSGCAGRKTQHEEFPVRHALRVAMDEDMPGYFVFGGESYGYQYELFTAYADHLGIPLEVVSGLSARQCSQMLGRGEIDFATLLSSHLMPEDRREAVTVCNTSYVLLTDQKRAKTLQPTDHSFSLSRFIGQGRVLIASGFKNSATYGQLLDSLSDAAIYVSGRNSFELIEELGNGAYDFVICEMSEAQLGCAFTKGIAQVYTFSEPVSLCALASKRDSLKQHFQTWLEDFRCSEEYAVLNDLYFERGIVRQVIGLKDARRNIAGGISVFDRLFKEISQQEGYDWRFLAAIAYCESRFDPLQISRQGAKGLMQVMPHLARRFNVRGNVMEPQNNVLLAARILTKIEKSIRFAPDTPENDRMQIMLACYNGGIGHVADARNLARKYGANPDSWETVSKYLRLKSEPEFSQDEVVRNGRFSGKQTLAFVDVVMSKYQTYCRNVARY